MSRRRAATQNSGGRICALQNGAWSLEMGCRYETGPYKIRGGLGSQGCFMSGQNWGTLCGTTKQKDNLWPRLPQLPYQLKEIPEHLGPCTILSENVLIMHLCREFVSLTNKEAEGKSCFFFLLKESVSSSWSSEKHQTTCCDPSGKQGTRQLRTQCQELWE